MITTQNHLPTPPHYDAKRVGEVWKVPYQKRAKEARAWAKQYGLNPAVNDKFRVLLLLVDVQNTFCIPEFELFVGGRSGRAAVSDNRRLCRFIYQNLDAITEICPTMDTHHAMQVFHSLFLVDDNGKHPEPFTLVSAEEIAAGTWKVNPDVAGALNLDAAYVQTFLEHYTQRLKSGGKYDLTVWPYHAMFGGIGHALVSSVEEAIFFHSISRYSRPDFQVKGNNPLTENYSVLRPEVLEDGAANAIAEKNSALVEKIAGFDACIIAGQAKSHCVAWTIADLLAEFEATDRSLAQKIYLLEDCTSPVVIPDVIDYTDPADAAFKKFEAAGMYLIRSTDRLPFRRSECTRAVHNYT